MTRAPAAVVLVVAALAASSGAPAAAASAGPLGRAVDRQVTRATAAAGRGATTAGYLTLSTDPVTVTTGGVTYHMRIDASRLLTSWAPDPALDVQLTRSTWAGGRMTGIQTHLYSYLPTGAGAHLTTVPATLATADFSTGTGLLPTNVALTFTAGSTRPAGAPCRLSAGGTGAVRHRRGTVATSVFAVATGTSPVFGTVATPPTAGVLRLDPGCAGPRPSRLPFCPARETISAGGSAAAHWEAEASYGGAVVETATLAPRGDSSAFVFHLVGGREPATALPPAHAGTQGATATLRTGSTAFLAGSARFISRNAPLRSVLHACTAHGRLHHFRAVRYGGALLPGPVPLAAGFDTGPRTLAGTVAALTVRRFVD